MKKPKSRQLKLWIGNYDGRREGLIYATSKTAAARILGISRSSFDNYWTEPARIVQHNGVAEFEPETLYTRPNHTYGGTFVKGRCPI